VDPVRLPKDGWYAHQVMWNTWVDADQPALHIIGHWNYAAGTVKNVSIVSTAINVRLVINGKSIGFGERSHNFLFTFENVTYQPGRLEAIGYSSKNQHIASDVKITSSEPAAIRLTPHVSPIGFLANGADTALIDVEVVDSNNTRCPTALNTINFTITGEAVWRGGIAQGPDNYILSKSLPVENGVNRIILRSTTTAGDIRLVANSDGLKSEEILLSTVPFETTDGLSTQIPSAGLPLDLSRGPTPGGTGFSIKRKTIQVNSVSSGFDSTTAGFTYDDDETTGWKSSSNTSSSWISYTFNSMSTINQVVMKLGSFRTKSYPVKVSVGNAAVWEGKTSTSLGYTTLTFNATVGSNVTIASTSGALSIIEVEFYGPV
jgi:beta-galactosidase